MGDDLQLVLELVPRLLGLESLAVRLTVPGCANQARSRVRCVPRLTHKLSSMGI